MTGQAIVVDWGKRFSLSRNRADLALQKDSKDVPFQNVLTFAYNPFHGDADSCTGQS